VPSTMTLEQFEIELRGLCADQTERPFICDGSPLDCEVFIVGFNPATEMCSDFWSFWDSDRGFNKQEWLDAYTSERNARQLKPGEQRRNTTSNTRRVIGWILNFLGPEVRCLETNIYSMATKKERDLPKSKRQTAIFEHLLDAIEPRVIVSHGEKARKYLETQSLQSALITERHFSRGWSELRAKALADRIKSELKGGDIQ